MSLKHQQMDDLRCKSCGYDLFSSWMEPDDLFLSIDRIFRCRCSTAYKLGYSEMWNQEDQDMENVFWLTEYIPNRVL